VLPNIAHFVLAQFEMPDSALMNSSGEARFDGGGSV
jgi:hypothetical protein